MSYQQHMLQGTATLQLKDAKFRIIIDDPECQLYTMPIIRHSGGDQQQSGNASNCSETGSYQPGISQPNPLTSQSHISSPGSSYQPSINHPTIPLHSTHISSSGGSYYPGLNEPNPVSFTGTLLGSSTGNQQQSGLNIPNPNSLPSPITPSSGSPQQQHLSFYQQPLASPIASSPRGGTQQQHSKFEPNFNSTFITPRPEPTSPSSPGGQPLNYTQPSSGQSYGRLNLPNDSATPTNQNVGIANSSYESERICTNCYPATPMPSTLQTQSGGASYEQGRNFPNSTLNLVDQSSLGPNRQRQNVHASSGYVDKSRTFEDTSNVSGTGTSSDSSSTYMEIIAKGNCRVACVKKIEEILVNLASELEDVGVSFESIINGLKNRGVSLDGVRIPDTSSSSRTYSGRNPSGGNSADHSSRLHSSTRSPANTSRSTRSSDRHGQGQQTM